MSNVNDRRTREARDALRIGKSFTRPKVEYESKFDRIKRRLLARKRGSPAAPDVSC